MDKSPAVLIPLAAIDLVRLLPAAARKLGWEARESSGTGNAVWRIALEVPDGRRLSSALHVEGGFGSWTSVRFEAEAEAALAPGERQRFMQALLAFARTVG